MAATFSYAQAAKGVATTQPEAKTASAEPTTPVSKPDEQSTNSDIQAEPEIAPLKTEKSEEIETVAISTDKDSESTATAPSKADIPGTSSPSVGASSTSTLLQEDEGSNTPNGTSESTWDKQSQASGTAKQTNGQDAKEKSEEDKKVPLKELKAAPLPAVNIWQQRIEAQEAKAKATTPVKPASTSKSGPSKSTSAASSTSGDVQQDSSKTVSKKKGTEAASEGFKDRKKADGGKGRDDGES